MPFWAGICPLQLFAWSHRLQARGCLPPAVSRNASTLVSPTGSPPCHPPQGKMNPAAAATIWLRGGGIQPRGGGVTPPDFLAAFPRGL